MCHWIYNTVGFDNTVLTSMEVGVIAVAGFGAIYILTSGASGKAPGGASAGGAVLPGGFDTAFSTNRQRYKGIENFIFVNSRGVELSRVEGARACVPILRVIMQQISILSPRMSGLLGGAAVERLREVSYAEAIQIYALLGGQEKVVQVADLQISLPSIGGSPLSDNARQLYEFFRMLIATDAASSGSA